MPKVKRLAILGVGMIGGSFALALKSKDAVTEVVGFGRSAERLQIAHDLGVIDRFSCELEEVIVGSDVVLLAMPIDASKRIFSSLAPLLQPGVVITDAGSVKQQVVDAACAVLGQALPSFVPGHPVAGKEKSGVVAADARLFEAHRVVLTPIPQTDRKALETVRGLWSATGAEVIEMDPADHDRLLAMTSHLPHAVAYALVNLLSEQQASERFFPLAAGGFYDLTRIASSDPVMWRDIFLNNPAALTDSIESYITVLKHIRDLIRAGNGEELEAIFKRAKQTRHKVGMHHRH